MAIDIHAHACRWDLYPTNGVLGLLASGSSAEFLSAAEGGRLVRAYLSDMDGCRHVKQMDMAGIELSVLVAMDFGEGYGPVPLDRMKVLACYRDLMERYPGRFIALQGVNPLKREALRQFIQSVEEYGFRGMKLHPPFGFPADHPCLDDFYGLCGDKLLPVMIHTGPSMPGLDWTLASPSRLRKVTGKHSRVNFILAHAGWQLEPEMVDMAVTQDNVYLDLAGFQTALEAGGEARAGKMMAMFKPGLSDKVVFGSDWPLFNILKPLPVLLDQLRALFAESRQADRPDILANILHGNALKALGGVPPHG